MNCCLFNNIIELYLLALLECVLVVLGFWELCVHERIELYSFEGQRQCTRQSMKNERIELYLFI